MSIPKTMKALVSYGKGKYQLERAYPVPQCGPEDILIKTQGCGVCAGDLKCHCFPYVIEKIHDGTLKTDGVVSSCFPMEQWEQAFEYATGKYGDFKVAITF